MPFGLTGAPSSFQRLMDHILREFPFVSRYIDDILIHSPTMELHVHHLKLVLEKLRKANLTLRGRKCKIGQPEVYYLGHVFSKSGMRLDGSKIKAVRDWPQPTDASDICRFLGLASYSKISLMWQPHSHSLHRKECYSAGARHVKGPFWL